MLCRDRFGIKPLYYVTQRGNLFFASEIKALFLELEFVLCCRRNDGRVTWPILLMAVLMKLFGEGVHQLPAGFLLHYNGYSLVEKRWYEFEKRVSLWSEESPDRLLKAFLEQM